MELLSLVAVSTYCGVSLFMAVRLLMLWSRTRERPELMIALAFLSGGMIGYPGAVAGRMLAAAGRASAGEAAHVIGQIGMALGAFFLLLSWRQIFHARHRGSLFFVVGWSVYMLVSLGLVVLESEPNAAKLLASPLNWSLMVANGGCYVAVGWSSHRYGRMIERRCAIGLGDPVVANRMALWALSNFAIVLSYANALVNGVLIRLGVGSFYHPVVVTGLGMTSALFVALAFFPPRAYLERIRARTSTGAS